MSIKLAIIGLLALAVLSLAEDQKETTSSADGAGEKNIRRQAVFGGIHVYLFSAA